MLAKGCYFWFLSLLFLIFGKFMAQTEQNNTLIVQNAEGGQKLLQFLVRRLNLPQPLLHRWIRTGQIRINGGRVKPFVHVASGDMVRIPPFALGMASSAGAENSVMLSHLPLPPLVYEDEHLLVYNKSFGLPVHTGTGHEDSLATRIAAHFEHAAFKPTPAHRLDKDTSGIILIARTYAALRLLQDCFEHRNITKEYLTWVHGLWPHAEPMRLSHNIGKSYVGYDEKVRILDEEKGRESECIATCLRQENNCSLMHIRLITGRTHQIRVQMAESGHAVLGDGKYGDVSEQSMLLHALRICLPDSDDFAQLNLQGKSFMVLPEWGGWQAVTEMALNSLDS